MVTRGVSENMRIVGKGATGRERKGERERQRGSERNGGGCKAVIRVLGVPWG